MVSYNPYNKYNDNGIACLGAIAGYGEKQTPSLSSYHPLKGKKGGPFISLTKYSLILKERISLSRYFPIIVAGNEKVQYL